MRNNSKHLELRLSKHKDSNGVVATVTNTATTPNSSFVTLVPVTHGKLDVTALQEAIDHVLEDGQTASVADIATDLADPTSGAIYFGSMEVETDSTLQPEARLLFCQQPDIALTYSFHSRSERIIARDQNGEFPTGPTTNGAIVLVRDGEDFYFYCEDDTLSSPTIDVMLSDKIYAFMYHILHNVL